MNSVKPPSPVFQAPPASEVAAVAAEPAQIQLRPEQILRATVVEGGLNRALLVMDQQHFIAESNVELQVGQNLTLQVLRTQPRLEFQVLNDPLGGKLSQLLPLLARSYDWQSLLDNLQQHGSKKMLPEAMPRVLSQLQQTLQTFGSSTDNLQQEIARTTEQVQQLLLTPPQGPDSLRFAAAPGLQPAAFTPATPTAMVAPLSKLAGEVVRQLQGHLESLAPGREQHSDGQRQVLAKLVDSLRTLAEPEVYARDGQLSLSTALLDQVRLQPNLPPPLVVGLLRLAERLKLSADLPIPDEARGEAVPARSSLPRQGQAAQSVSQPLTETADRLTPPGRPTASADPGILAAGSSAADRIAIAAPEASATQESKSDSNLISGLGKLLEQVRGLRAEQGGLSPDLVGRLEGLQDQLVKLRASSAQGQSGHLWIPGLDAVMSQLQQITQQPGLHPEGGQLGVLSQLFGFHLETELLQGKQRNALASLKLALLELREELGEKADEPLRRLEILQLCKAKLHEQQIQFLPLPFSELKEGYLLVEERPAAAAEDESEPPLQLSLSLALSALGNLRIDLLYDKGGLHVRMASEDKERMGYLQSFRQELETTVVSVPLQGVSFAADAKPPSRQLLQRLLPEASGMLDSRI